MTPTSMLLALLSPVVVFAAIASSFVQSTTANTLVPTSTTNTQSPGAVTTSGPPIIVLDTSSENTTRTTFTTTFEGGDVITGVFELKTLAEYTDLRQHLTVTSTTTYNGTDGLVETAVVAGIVMAGGTTVCYFLPVSCLLYLCANSNVCVVVGLAQLCRSGRCF